MQAIKVIGLSLLSFLLFVSLVIFSVAFMVNGTALNPKFITKEINRIDVSSIAIEIMEEEFEDDADFSEELKTALYDTIEETEPVIKSALNEAILSVGNYLRGKTDEPELAQVLSDTFLNGVFVADLLAAVDIPAVVEASIDTDEIDEELLASIIDTVSEIEPELKEQAAAASGPIFDYLLAETDSIDLKQTLRDTLLSTDFTTSLIDNLDISPLVSDFLEDNISDIIPGDLDFITDELDDTIAAIEPTLKQALSNNTDDILDYLLGETSTMSVVISLEPVRDNLEDALRQTVLDNLPPEWEGLPQAEIDQRVDDFITDAMDVIPDTFEFDEELLGSELPEQITDGLAEAEEALDEARDSIHDGLSEAEDRLDEARGWLGWFITGYWGLIALIVVLILAIIGIYRQVKGASLHLGIMFLVLGIIEYAGILVSRSVIGKLTWEWDIPVEPLQDPARQLLTDVTGPLATLNIGLIVVGIILIAAAILYPRLRPSETS